VLPLVLVLALVVACQPRADVVTARDLVREPGAHDAQRIVITGIAQNPRLGSSIERGTYTTFTLADGTARIPVIAPGTQDVQQGDLVEVRGVFRDRLELGHDDVRGVVEARFLWPRRKTPGIPGTPTTPP
jgi:hypothetical protein